eukprot:364488-Chlamydomonas_euryale.AAC.2
MGKDSKAFSAAMKVAEDEDRKATILRRESRGAADTPEELVEYFLNTAAEDMDFEVARNRPKLSDEFFKCAGGRAAKLGGNLEKGRGDEAGQGFVRQRAQRAQALWRVLQVHACTGHKRGGSGRILQRILEGILEGGRETSQGVLEGILEGTLEGRKGGRGASGLGFLRRGMHPALVGAVPFSGRRSRWQAGLRRCRGTSVVCGVGRGQPNFWGCRD